jgi:hypothetical protein
LNGETVNLYIAYHSFVSIVEYCCWLWIPFVEWVLIRAVILGLKVVSNSMWSIKISFGFYLLLDTDMVETLGITDA